MSMLSFILLVFFVGKCSGDTRFMYDEAVKLECETNKWQVSMNSDNRIDRNCSVQCRRGKADCAEVEHDKPADGYSQSTPVCTLKEKSGYFACVKSWILEPGYLLYPFKSSSTNIIRSYIIARPYPALTPKPVRRSSVDVAEGRSVTLNCSFSLTKGFDLNQCTVYWIKTVEQSSTCIYSYNTDGNREDYGLHCDEEDESRVSHTTGDQFTHNIEIREVKRSDRGQYRCAIQIKNHGKAETAGKNWKVIEDVTLNVYNPTLTHSSGQTAMFAVILVVLCVLLAGLALFIRRRRFPPAGFLTVHQQRNQKEASDADCSPYAVGRGDQEFGFNNSSSRTADPDHEEFSEDIDPYSVIILNDIYDSSA